MTLDVEAIRARLDGNPWMRMAKDVPTCKEDARTLLDALAAEQQRVADLRAALLEYGDHKASCPHWYRLTHPCACGYDALAATAPAVEGAS